MAPEWQRILTLSTTDSRLRLHLTVFLSSFVLCLCLLNSMFVLICLVWFHYCRVLLGREMVLG